MRLQWECERGNFALADSSGDVRSTAIEGH